MKEFKESTTHCGVFEIRFKRVSRQLVVPRVHPPNFAAPKSLLGNNSSRFGLGGFFVFCRRSYQLEVVSDCLTVAEWNGL